MKNPFSRNRINSYKVDKTKFYRQLTVLLSILLLSSSVILPNALAFSWRDVINLITSPFKNIQILPDMQFPLSVPSTEKFTKTVTWTASPATHVCYAGKCQYQSKGDCTSKNVGLCDSDYYCPYDCGQKTTALSSASTSGNMAFTTPNCQPSGASSQYVCMLSNTGMFITEYVPQCWNQNSKITNPYNPPYTAVNRMDYRLLRYGGCADNLCNKCPTTWSGNPVAYCDVTCEKYDGTIVFTGKIGANSNGIGNQYDTKITSCEIAGENTLFTMIVYTCPPAYCGNGAPAEVGEDYSPTKPKCTPNSIVTTACYCESDAPRPVCGQNGWEISLGEVCDYTDPSSKEVDCPTGGKKYCYQDPSTGDCAYTECLNCDDGLICTQDNIDSSVYPPRCGAHVKLGTASSPVYIAGCDQVISTCKKKGCIDGVCSDVITPNCCGNGKCEPPETSTGCPTDCVLCDDGNPCTSDTYDYTNGKCVYTTIIPCCGDGICTSPQENANLCSKDCSPKCGNNVIESGEDCESGTPPRDCYTPDGKKGKENCVTCKWSGTCVSDWTCISGLTQNCGKCGVQLCGPPDAPDGKWGPCKNEGVCMPGTPAITQSCGKCGTQAKNCLSNCQWGDWGACTGEGQCSVGLVESCSVGGIPGQRTCQPTCSWSPCQQVGDCVPGNTRTCGLCGTQTCPATGKWGDSSCNNQGICASGDSKVEKSPQGCDQVLICNNKCQYPPIPVDECIKGTVQGCSPSFSIWNIFSTYPGEQVCQDNCKWSVCTYTDSALIIATDKASYTTTDAIIVTVKTGLEEGQAIQGILTCKQDCAQTVIEKQTGYIYIRGSAKETVFTFGAKPKGLYEFKACYPTCDAPSLEKYTQFRVYPVFKIFEVTGATSQAVDQPVMFNVRLTDETGKGLSQERGEVELIIFPRMPDGGVIPGSIQIDDHRDGTYKVSINTKVSETIDVEVEASSAKYGIAKESRNILITISTSRIYIDTSKIPRNVETGDIIDIIIETKTPTEPRTNIDADYIRVWMTGPIGQTVNEWYINDLAHTPGSGVYTIFNYEISSKTGDIELWNLYIQADALTKGLESNRVDGLGISVNPGTVITPPACEVDQECEKGFVCRAGKCVACKGWACTGIDIVTIGIVGLLLGVVGLIWFIL